MMSTSVLFCPLLSIPYCAVGKMLSKQLFHVFCDSLPEYAVLSVPVHPSTKLTLMEIPDEYK